MDDNARKLAALELLNPLREEGKKYIWQIVRDDETIEFEGVVIDGHDQPVDFYTIFAHKLPAEVVDEFQQSMHQAHEAKEIEIGAEEVRAIRVSMTPVRSLKALADGGGIVDGVWPKWGDGGNVHAEALPKSDKAKMKVISGLDTGAIYMLLTQAIDYYLGERGVTGDPEAPASPMAEAVDDAGKSPSSADES